MYDNILVPIIFDHEHDHAKALEFAKAVAGPEAKITLLHVIETLPAYVTTYVPEKISQDLHADLQAHMQRLRDQIPEAEGKIVSGHPSRTIIEHANANAVDLIIVESHRPGLEDYFLGSTAGYVVRHARCCVHVIR